MQKFLLFPILAILFCCYILIANAQFSPGDYLSGNVSLILEQGLWKPLDSGISYQDLTLDLICHHHQCEPEIWGFADQFNQAEHEGTVTIRQSNKTWYLQVKLTINRDPWLPFQGEANYQIELQQKNNELVGHYQGTFNNQSLQGKVIANISPLFPPPLPHHQPIQPQEHPRLIFRSSQLPSLRQKAHTQIGQIILTQLKQTLTQPISYQGYVPNAGYHAAGQCFLAILNQDPKMAESAWPIVATIMNQPASRLFEQSPMVAGVALAYDLCYPFWEIQHRSIVTNWLAQQAQIFIDGTAKGDWNPTAWSNWNARVRGSAGLAALAILEEPESYFSESTDVRRLLTIAQRNITRYLSTAIGDRGFGSEGDHYTTEPWILTLFPFFQAYRQVEGKDFIENSHAAWLLPQYLMRIVPQDGQYPIPPYGRHRRYGGGSLFAMGLGSVPGDFLPGVMAEFNRYWGMDGDRSFGINSPQEGIFAFVNYPAIAPQNPAAIFGHVLVDEKKGFYVFRNQWQGENDFVASIYAKRQSLPKSWSFPDAGSFRIWGLGGHWSNTGKGEGKPDNENVILTETSKNITMEPIFFQSGKDGSAVVSLQGENWLRSFAVDYSGKAGVPGLFVIVDRFSNNDGNKTWVMHPEGEVTIQGQQFMIKGNNGASMQGTFITPQQVKLTYQPEEKRILATGGEQFFVVMTVQQETAPTIEVDGQNLEAKVTIGQQGITFQNQKINFNIK